jgi:hypothetical protein
MSKGATNFRHVVWFEFKPEVTPPRIEQMAKAFASFCLQLNFVSALEWGANSSTEGINLGFTHCFIVSFADATGRDAYLVHPLHQRFCAQELDPILHRVAVIDYQIKPLV